jgi:hypothetical protein
MYVDDLILFTKPNDQDLQLLKSIFDIFHGASGLVITYLNVNLLRFDVMKFTCSWQQLPFHVRWSIFR